MKATRENILHLCHQLKKHVSGVIYETDGPVRFSYNIGGRTNIIILEDPSTNKLIGHLYDGEKSWFTTDLSEIINALVHRAESHTIPITAWDEVLKELLFWYPDQSIHRHGIVKHVHRNNELIVAILHGGGISSSFSEHNYHQGYFCKVRLKIINLTTVSTVMEIYINDEDNDRPNEHILNFTGFNLGDKPMQEYLLTRKDTEDLLRLADILKTFRTQCHPVYLHLC